MSNASSPEHHRRYDRREQHLPVARALKRLRIPSMRPPRTKVSRFKLQFGPSGENAELLRTSNQTSQARTSRALPRQRLLPLPS
ncbi:protein of unknown function [Candidatus Filomicrobium marinum]|uniref:Uncharacterized protein n=1 Tax=Candidatus Filomicrobium marinum TaxID=1608628 RepID=A0A0D6JJG8_9HYPH|nr:protein of unknown function [Candidatus Filomicrobium marinum]